MKNDLTWKISYKNFLNFHILCLALFLFSSYFISSFEPAICYSTSQPKVCNLSRENLFFVGRENQLLMIHEFFKKDERRILAITGGPGFGKTQIAKKYALEFAGDYDLIWWFDAGQDIPSQFEKLATALNTLLPEKEKIIPSTMSKEALIDAVKNILRLKPIQYLFIFDNAEEYARLEKFIPSAHQNFKKNVLLTSRVASVWPDKVEIGKFKREESLCLIRSTLPKEKKENMEKLAEALADYPLELSLALAFIKSHPTVSIDRYLSMHIKRLQRRGRSPNMLLDQYPDNSLGALEISLRYIEEESEDSLKALFFISLLNSKDIPETYIELWLKKTNSPLTADESIKHIYDQSLLGVSETTEFNVNKKSEGQEDMHYLSIHDLIHQFINEKLTLEEKKKLLEAATDVMLEVFAGLADTFTKKVTKEPIHLLHAQKLYENAMAIHYSSHKLLQLKVCIFQCLMAAFRDFEAAQLLSIDIEKDLERGLTLDPYYKALFKINKGSLEANRTNYEMAIQYMKEGLIILTPYEAYKGDKLRAISNLIQYYAMEGKSHEADKLMTKGNAIFKKLDSIIYKSFFLYVCSIILNDQGKFTESLDTLNKTNVYPMLSTDYPPIYHAILLQKIETYIKLGQLEKARKYGEELDKTLQKFYTKKSVMLANMLLAKSFIFLLQKKELSQCISSIKEALQVYENSFRGNSKHRNQARAHLALGKAHKMNKDHKEALNAYLLSEEIYNIVLKENKIDDLSDLYKELALLGIAMKDDGLTYKYLKAHMNIFGHSHPRTQEILQSLDKNGLVAPF